MSQPFLDGTGITPGTEACKCGSRCEFPCWQRLGWAPACESCGCPDLSPVSAVSTVPLVDQGAASAKQPGGLLSSAPSFAQPFASWSSPHPHRPQR